MFASIFTLTLDMRYPRDEIEPALGVGGQNEMPVAAIGGGVEEGGSGTEG